MYAVSKYLTNEKVRISHIASFINLFIPAFIKLLLKTAF